MSIFTVQYSIHRAFRASSARGSMLVADMLWFTLAISPRILAEVDEKGCLAPQEARVADTSVPASQPGSPHGQASSASPEAHNNKVSFPKRRPARPDDHSVGPRRTPLEANQLCFHPREKVGRILDKRSLGRQRVGFLVGERNPLLPPARLGGLEGGWLHFYLHAFHGPHISRLWGNCLRWVEHDRLTPSASRFILLLILRNPHRAWLS